MEIEKIDSYYYACEYFTVYYSEDTGLYKYYFKGFIKDVEGLFGCVYSDFTHESHYYSYSSISGFTTVVESFEFYEFTEQDIKSFFEGDILKFNFIVIGGHEG